MTVLVRPVPRRVAGNAIRPFVRPPVSGFRPVTIKTWRSPVPEPLPPAPLLGPKELLGLGLLVLAQIWGYFRKKEQLKPTGTAPLQVPGAYGTYAVTTTYINEASELRRCSDGALLGAATYSASPSTINQVGYGVQFTPADVTARGICGPGTSNNAQVNIGEYRTFKADGTLNTPTYRVAGAQVGDTYNSTNSRTFRKRVQLDKITLNGVDLTPYTWGDPVPTPEVEPEVAKPPALPPLITPVRPAPPIIEPEIRPEIAPVEPGPSRPPATTPARPPVFRPVRPQAPTNTKDGAVLPKPADPVTVTDPDWHFPVPGAGPITGNGPQAKPEEIAKELGRLEQKLARLSNPATDEEGQGEDRLKLLKDNIGNIIDFFMSMTAGGGYSISSPCETDENGNVIEHVVEYGGAAQSLGVISNKIDALAELLQTHKNLKQPICKQAPAVGENVTVNFVQVD